MKKAMFLFTIVQLLLFCDNHIDDIIVTFKTKILADYNVSCIAFDNNGSAWIGTFKQGLIKYSSTETIVYNSSNSIISDSSAIYDIKVDSKNNIWIGTEGLIKYDGKSFKRFNGSNSPISEKYIGSIAIDSKDNIWFESSSYQQGGLIKYDGSSWVTYTPDNSKLPINNITGICVDKSDNIWLAQTEKVEQPFLVKISNDVWTVYSRNDFANIPYYFGDIQANRMSQITIAINHMVGGGYTPQVFIFDGKATQTLEFDNSTIIYHLKVDKDDNIWCTGSSGILAVYNGGKWYKQYFKEGTNSIEQSPDGKMWLGSEKGVYISELSYN